MALPKSALPGATAPAASFTSTSAIRCAYCFRARRRASRRWPRSSPHQAVSSPATGSISRFGSIGGRSRACHRFGRRKDLSLDRRYDRNQPVADDRRRRGARIPAARDDPVRRRPAAPQDGRQPRPDRRLSRRRHRDLRPPRPRRALYPRAAARGLGGTARRPARLGRRMHLDGDVAAIIDEPACFDGAAGFATLILAPAGQDPQQFSPAPARCKRRRGRRSSRRAPRWSAAFSSPAGSPRTRCCCAAPMPISLAICAPKALGLPRRMPRIWHV